MSGFGALALRRADSHWLRSFTFCREWGVRGEVGLKGRPAPPSLAAAHFALEVGGVQRPRAVLRHHLHHVRQLEGALVHTLHGADVRHGDGGAHLGDRIVLQGGLGAGGGAGSWGVGRAGTASLWVCAPRGVPGGGDLRPRVSVICEHPHSAVPWRPTA